MENKYYSNYFKSIGQGLTDSIYYLDHQKMIQILKTESNLDQQASKLLQAVLETPAKDNITFILMNTPSLLKVIN